MAAAAGEGYTTATAVADALVELGVPFRAAHGVAGRPRGGRGGRWHQPRGGAGRGDRGRAARQRTTRRPGRWPRDAGIGATRCAARRRSRARSRASMSSAGRRRVGWPRSSRPRRSASTSAEPGADATRPGDRKSSGSRLADPGARRWPEEEKSWFGRPAGSPSPRRSMGPCRTMGPAPVPVAGTHRSGHHRRYRPWPPLGRWRIGSPFGTVG